MKRPRRSALPSQKGVQEPVQSVEFLEDAAELEVRHEGIADLGPGEEMVVVVAVDEPVPRAALSGVVAELRRENGQEQVAAGLQDAGDPAPVARPVARDHVVEAAVVEEAAQAGGAAVRRGREGDGGEPYPGEGGIAQVVGPEVEGRGCSGGGRKPGRPRRREVAGGVLSQLGRDLGGWKRTTWKVVGPRIV